ncbi:DUF1837 domain-containing protein [Shewanella sp. MM_2022_3]|uniref:HamA C-terminal domain-containing protein n=1 Tax=Shewanella sp. MM_2022_3 TaxID=2923280 RepID=UPI001F4C0D30|nr:DUF1837 domain-containing protein [Shewanella sp. MM_2022_3]MCH7424989.1 DUF1837 domain-containing protein [Shewanella sp. MM_2022_3]
MNFEVLVDEQFMDICLDKNLNPIKNKNVLSIINDFQDGKWRYSKFRKFIWDNIAETALSYDERKSLVNESYSALVESAKSLRLTDTASTIGQGSELAEIILYGIMKHHYGALPAVPKIFYKQNAQDNAKGADSVHIVLKNDEDFTIWFGEAKFFNDISNERLNEIVKSVGNSLATDKLKRENAIITNIKDIDSLIDNESLKSNIKNALSAKNSIDSIKPKLHIPILLLHECEYTSSCTTISESYKQNVIKFHHQRPTAYFKKHLKALKDIHLYEKITFHLILFPVPNKTPIIDSFIKDVKHYKEAEKDV